MKAEQPEERARFVRQKAQRPGAFGLLIVLVVLGAVAALYFAMRDGKPAQAQPEATEKVDPFADLPPETPPEKQATTKGEAARPK